ncbi:MAG: DUF4843 domain-containing protein [Bacteroidales bacterium]|nr:DUF4843 domain-containing protein [Bacteroidales bacterium]
MKTLKYICTALIILLLGACDENETMLYNTEFNALNFKLETGYTKLDSLYVNFMFLPNGATTEKVKVKVKLMGMPVETDRYYKISEVQDESSAEANVHYTALHEKYLFPAGETEAYFELEVKRDESMRENTYRLMLQFVENEDFKSGIESEQSFIINITDNLLVPPPFWEANYLHYKAGPYHWKKCKKYIEIAGVDNPDWHPEPYAAGDVYVKEARIWFEENPTFDEEGNRLYFENR